MGCRANASNEVIIEVGTKVIQLQNCHLKTEFVLYWKEKCGKNPKVFHKWIFLSPLRSSYRKMWIWSPEKVGKKTWVEKLLHGSLWYKEFYFNHKKNTNVIWRTFGDPCWKVFLYVRLNSLLKMFNPVRKHVLVRRMFWISFFFFFSFFFVLGYDYQKDISWSGSKIWTNQNKQTLVIVSIEIMPKRSSSESGHANLVSKSTMTVAC